LAGLWRNRRRDAAPSASWLYTPMIVYNTIYRKFAAYVNASATAHNSIMRFVTRSIYIQMVQYKMPTVGDISSAYREISVHTMHRCGLCWYLLLVFSFMLICLVLGRDAEVTDDENDYDYDIKYNQAGWLHHSC